MDVIPLDNESSSSVSEEEDDDAVNQLGDTGAIIKYLISHYRLFNKKAEDIDASSQSLSDGYSDESTEEKIEMYLRDSLIKSFMIVFTNEKSQHLLLNQDLIEIAFNCMQNSTDITLEA